MADQTKGIDPLTQALDLLIRFENLTQHSRIDRADLSNLRIDVNAFLRTEPTATPEEREASRLNTLSRIDE